MALQNHYKLLGIGVEATPEDIKQSFRRLARRYHPDFNPGDTGAEAQFRQICQAYEVLIDPEQRWRYDQSQHVTNQVAAEFKREAAKPDYKTLFEEGLQQVEWRDYAAAVDWFNQVIELKPHFWQAYLERAHCYYIQGNDPGVLADCQHVLRYQPNNSKAHFLQGRTQHRLGHLKSALEAYSRAIAQEQSAAQAFYYRGMANQELKQTLLAMADYQTAQLLYRQQRDNNGYELATAALRGLERFKRPNLVQILFRKLKTWLTDIGSTLWLYLLNPGGNLFPAFARLSRRRAAGVGAGLLLFGQASITLASVWRGLPWQAGLVNLLLPGIGLIFAGPLLQLFLGRWQGLAVDIFLAGTTLFPVGLGLCAVLLIGQTLPAAMLAILLLVGWYALLTLYTGCCKLYHFSEGQAAFAVPILVFAAGALLYFVSAVQQHRF